MVHFVRSVQLGEYDRMRGHLTHVADPDFTRFHRRCVHDELLSGWVERRRGLHVFRVGSENVKQKRFPKNPTRD